MRRKQWHPTENAHPIHTPSTLNQSQRRNSFTPHPPTSRAFHFHARYSRRLIQFLPPSVRCSQCVYTARLATYLKVIRPRTCRDVNVCCRKRVVRRRMQASYGSSSGTANILLYLMRWQRTKYIQEYKKA